MKFFIPAELEKSNSQAEMRIRGLASTPDLDRDNQSILQEGLDIDDFVNYGFFNDDHDSGTILGYPDKERTKVTDQGLYVEGTLLPTPRGKELWETALALQKSNTDRRLGFSVEGKVLKKDNAGNILKAKIYNVAITANPVNPHARWEALVKSMSKAMTTDTGKPLIRESLESAVKVINQALDGDEEKLNTLENWVNRFSMSNNKEDIEAYLTLFKGYEGKQLDEYTRQVQELLGGKE